jgi:hypothetical protein
MKFPFPENIEAQEDLHHTIILKRSDGMVEVRCGDVTIYTAEKVKENHACLKRFAKGKKIIALTIAGYYTHVLPEARKYTAKGHHREFIAAEAFLIASFPQWIIGYIFLKINRPIVPANIFLLKHKDKAEKWLRKFAAAN